MIVSFFQVNNWDVVVRQSNWTGGVAVLTQSTKLNLNDRSHTLPIFPNWIICRCIDSQIEKLRRGEFIGGGNFQNIVHYKYIQQERAGMTQHYSERLLTCIELLMVAETGEVGWLIRALYLHRNSIFSSTCEGEYHGWWDSSSPEARYHSTC